MVEHNVPPLGGLVGAESKFPDRLFPHSEFLNLAGHGHWEVGSETYVTSNLVGCDLAATVFTNFILVCVLTLAQPDPDANLFAVFFVGHTDDLDVADLGMCIQKFFNLALINILAAANDHVFKPTDDIHITIVAHDCQITRVHPTTLVDCGSCSFGIVPISEHYQIAPCAQLAALSAGYDLAGPRINDFTFDMGMDL